MDNNLMQMMMQMMMQNQQMMNMMMAQAMQQSTPASKPMMETIAQNNEAMSAQPSDSVNAQISELKSQIESLKSQLATTTAKLTTTTKELQTARETITKMQQNITINVPEKQVEGQLTLEDEIKYQSRHGSEGHENYTRIMDQLSEDDRQKVREMYFADSDGVFSLEEMAQKKGTTFEDIFYALHPEMKDHPSMVEFTTDVNEFGF